MHQNDMLNGDEALLRPAAESWSKELAEDLKRFLQYKLHCPELAADFTHDIYLKLAAGNAPSADGNLRPLAFRIAANLVIDHHRKAEVRSRYECDGDEALLAGESASHYPSPEQIVDGRERLQKMHNALLELPVSQRTAFVFHAVDGLSYDEIARRMGVSKSSVNLLLAQAMKHCAKQTQI